jgi:uncharacterized protein (TIGR02217 family)
MAFLETPRFPDRIGYTSAGGPSFSTDVVQVASGVEVRNANWAAELMQYDIAHSARTQSEIDELLAFFRARRGKAEGFRFKDHADYSATVSSGILDSGVGDGYPTYQLNKRYTTGAVTHDRKIVKPVSGSITLYRGGSPVTFGAAAGNASLDTTTGVATFVSDNTQSITAITPGATTTITIAAAQSQLTVGEKVYISGVGGSIGAALNGIAHTISAKTNPTDLTFTIATNTTGLIYTSGGSCYAYPQAGESLTWAGAFDVPVRFDVDDFKASIIGGTPSARIYQIDALPLVELRL